MESYSVEAFLKASGVGDFSRQMNNATKQLDGLERSTGNVGLTMGGLLKTIGLVAAAAGAFRMIRNSVQTAFERIDTMERFGRVMNVMVDDVGDINRALDRTNDIVTGTAYRLDTAAASVQNFVTRGLDVDKATDYIEAFGDAVAFYGNGSDAQFSNVADALSKMVTKGTVGMDQLNRLFDAGIPAVDIYAQAVGRSADAVQNDLSKGNISAVEFIDTVSSAMMEGTNGVADISGAAKEAGASWGAVWGNMRIAVARGVVNIIESIDEMLKSSGLPDMRAMVVEFGRQFNSVLNMIADGIPSVVDKFKEWYTVLEPYMPIIKNLAVAVGIYVTVLASLNSILKTVTITFNILRAVFVASPFMMIIAVIAALVGAFIYLWRTNDNFRAAVEPIWNAIKELITNAIQVVSDFIIQVMGKLKEWWGENQESIFETASMIWNTILSVINMVVTEIVSFVMAIWATLTEFWDEHGQMILEAAQNVWNVISTVITTVMDVIWNVMKFLWPFIKMLIIDTWNAIKGVIQGAINVILGIIRFFAALFTGNWSEMWEAVKQILGGAVQLIWNLLQLWLVGKVMKVGRLFASGFRSIFSGLWNAIRNLFRKGVDNALKIITNMRKSFYNAGRGLIDQMIKGITNMIGKVKNSVTNVVSSVRNLLPFSPAKEGPLSDLDKLDFAGPIADSVEGATSVVQKALDSLLTLPAIQDTEIQGFNTLIDNVKNQVDELTNVIQSSIGVLSNFMKVNPTGYEDETTEEKARKIEFLTKIMPLNKVVIKI